MQAHVNILLRLDYIKVRKEIKKYRVNISCTFRLVFKRIKIIKKLYYNIVSFYKID